MEGKIELKDLKKVRNSRRKCATKWLSSKLKKVAEKQISGNERGDKVEKVGEVLRAAKLALQWINVPAVTAASLQ